MERAIASAEQKISLLDEEMNYFTGNEEGGELTSEEIVRTNRKAVSEKKTIESAIAKVGKSEWEHLKFIDEKETLLRTLRVNADEIDRRTII